MYYERLLPGGFIKEGEEEPEIGGLEFYYDAFRELNSCRPVGFDLGPIPFTAIHEYSRIYDVGEFDEFLDIMRILDGVFLKLNREQEKKATGDRVAANQHNKNNKGSSRR